MSRALGWCFTSYDVNSPPVYKPELHEYLVYGREVCPSTNRQHLQGFVRYKNRKRFPAVKSDIGTGAHLEVSRGSPKEAADYCKKDGQFTEHGDLPANAGRNNSHADVLRLAKEGNIAEIQETYPGMFLRYRNSILSTVEFRKEELNSSCGVWICGPPRCGKDASVRKLGNVYSKPLSKWWDGYNNEKYVLISDVEPGHAQWLGFFLKIWADRYPFNAEIKGGCYKIRPERVFVTSNFLISDVFKGEILAALVARFSVVNEFDNSYTPRPIVPVSYRVLDVLLEKENIPAPVQVTEAVSSTSNVPQKEENGYSSSEDFQAPCSKLPKTDV